MHVKKSAWVPLAVALVLPAPADADLPAPAPNGQIVFSSGRDDPSTLAVEDNTTSQLWLVTISGDPGSATRLTSPLHSTSHHRHPSWSPDRTKLAYARGPDDDNLNGPWSIVVHDVLLGRSTTIASASKVQDRPAWSPDGTELAYQRDTDDADGTANWVIETRPAVGGLPTTVATGIDTATSSQFTRPHWTPDGQSILYGKRVAANDHDIYQAPADGGDPAGDAVVAGATNDYQPHVSPAGDRICFTRDVGDRVVVTATIDGGEQQVLTPLGGPDQECAWSPDTTRILYTHGESGTAELHARRSDGSGPVSTVANAPNPAFDGSGDWAANARPRCDDGTAGVDFDGVVRIPLRCGDAESDELALHIVTGPEHGVIGPVLDDDTLLYEPDGNFHGTDTFAFKANDGASDSPPATISVTVRGPVPIPELPPVISNLKVTPRTWRRGAALPQFALAARGTKITFDLSEPASTTVRFRRRTTGRRVGGRCRRQTRTNRAKPRCTRFVAAGSIRLDGGAGSHTLRFPGRLSPERRLRLGRYRVIASATDSAGLASTTTPRASFRIVRR